MPSRHRTERGSAGSNATALGSVPTRHKRTFGLNGGSFLKLVVVIVISAPGENHWNVRLFLFHRSRHVTDRDADSWACARIGIRAVDEVGVMKRHFTRSQNDIDRMVHIQGIADCMTSCEDVCLLRFFEVLERSRV